MVAERDDITHDMFVAIAEAEAQQLNIHQKLKRLYMLRAEATCPFKVGDILVNEGGKRARLTEILSASSSYRPYCLRGRFILTNGKESKREQELYLHYNWVKEVEG